MLLVIHIIIALSSLFVSTYLFFRPSKTGLMASYGLVAATLTSGTFLVISAQSHMLQACVSGLVYLGFVAFLIAAAHQKLARKYSYSI